MIVKVKETYNLLVSSIEGFLFAYVDSGYPSVDCIFAFTEYGGIIKRSIFAINRTY